MVIVPLTDAVTRARHDAEECAEEVMRRNGWRRAPAQSLAIPDLIKGQPMAATLEILTAWNSAYHRRCIDLSNAIESDAR